MGNAVLEIGFVESIGVSIFCMSVVFGVLVGLYFLIELSSGVLKSVEGKMKN